MAKYEIVERHASVAVPRKPMWTAKSEDGLWVNGTQTYDGAGACEDLLRAVLKVGADVVVKTVEL